MGASELERQAERELRSAQLLQVVDLATVMRTEPEPPEYVVAPYIPRSVVTVLGAHGGVGKSVLSLAIAAHVPEGRDWEGFPVAAGRALFLSLEDPASLVRYRLRRIIDAFGLDPEVVTRGLLVLDGSEGDGALAREDSEFGHRVLPTAAMAELSEHAEGCTLIVVDNASDAFDANENNRRQVRQFLRTLTQLARSTRSGVLLLAHIDKNAARYGGGGNTYSGSTAWHNSARSRLALVEKSGGLVTLSHEKANLSERAVPLTLRWSSGGVLIATSEAAEPGMATADTDAVLAAIRAAAAAGVDVPAARTGPATAQHVLATFDALPDRLRGSSGRSGFWTAVGRLFEAGRIETREVWTASRHRKQMIVEPSPVPDRRATPTPPSPEPAKPAMPVRQFADSVETREPAQTGETGDSGAADYRSATRGE